MSKRILFIILGVISLGAGGIIYLFSRNGMYITKPFEHMSCVKVIRLTLAGTHFVHISHYFPDFLWGYSLCSFLVAIFDNGLKKVFFCALTAFSWGTFWEILQYLSIVQGTGDVIDIIMYLLAVVAVIIIYILKERKNEKTT